MKKFKFFKKNKKANLLTENIIFIILNLVFLTILILFLLSKMSNPAILEEKYAKQIALMIDSSSPVMRITMNMGDAIKIAREEGWPEQEIVNIDGNIVTVKLRENGGYSYSFFNDVKINDPYLVGENYVFVIDKKEQNEL